MVRNSIKAAFIAVLLFVLMTPADATSAAEDLTDGPVYSLRDALALGLQNNLNLRLTLLTIPINRENVIINDAEFDPVVDASVSSLEQKDPTASPFSEEDFDLYRATGADVEVSKKFRLGLESSLSFETNRSMNNSSIDSLRPQYRDFVILDFTQPLLRDFGSHVNTADLRISENRVKQAVFSYTARAQDLAQDIETTYYILSSALNVLHHRIESQRLSKELLQGNRGKFEAGIIPVTEVQEAETAVASRDEKVLLAMQHVEKISNRLKDLLEIRPGDPFYERSFLTEALDGIHQSYPPLTKALAVALEKRPVLQQQRLESINRDISIEYYRNQRLPRIDLEATLGLNGLSGSDRPVSFPGITPSTPHKGDYADALSDMAEGEGYEWYVGLRFSFPLGNRAAEARYRQADQEKRQAIYRLKRLEG